MQPRQLVDGDDDTTAKTERVRNVWTFGICGNIVGVLFAANR